MFFNLIATKSQSVDTAKPIPAHFFALEQVYPVQLQHWFVKETLDGPYI